MKKLFQLFKIQRSARIKTSFTKETLAGEKAVTKTETKAYLTMPMAFDFTAYYDDNELENNSEDIPGENTHVDVKADFFCISVEECTTMLHSTDNQKFECCTN